jgi:hypothetical protein
MTQTKTEIQTEIQTRLNDCFTRLCFLEQSSLKNQQQLVELSLSLGKISIADKQQIPALFKPKQLELN